MPSEKQEKISKWHRLPATPAPIPGLYLSTVQQKYNVSHVSNFKFSSGHINKSKSKPVIFLLIYFS